jgi:hypothetical protein
MPYILATHYIMFISNKNIFTRLHAYDGFKHFRFPLFKAIMISDEAICTNNTTYFIRHPNITMIIDNTNPYNPTWRCSFT